MFGYTQDAANTLTVSLQGIGARQGVWPFKASGDTDARWIDYSEQVAAWGSRVVSVSPSLSNLTVPGGSLPTLANYGSDGVQTCFVFSGGVADQQIEVSCAATFDNGAVVTYVALISITTGETAGDSSSGNTLVLDSNVVLPVLVGPLVDSDIVVVLRGGVLMGAGYALFTGSQASSVSSGLDDSATFDNTIYTLMGWAA